MRLLFQIILIIFIFNLLSSHVLSQQIELGPNETFSIGTQQTIKGLITKASQVNKKGTMDVITSEGKYLRLDFLNDTEFIGCQPFPENPKLINCNGKTALITYSQVNIKRKGVWVIFNIHAEKVEVINKPSTIEPKR
jgi:hypothetical protein